MPPYSPIGNTTLQSYTTFNAVLYYQCVTNAESMKELYYEIELEVLEEMANYLSQIIVVLGMLHTYFSSNNVCTYTYNFTKNISEKLAL